MLITDGQCALAARSELGVEDAGLVFYLDDKRVGGDAIGDGGLALAGDGGHSGPPGLLLLLGDVIPRRERSRGHVAVGLVGGSCEAVDVGARPPSLMPEGRLRTL